MPCETPPYSLISFFSGAIVAIVAALVGHIFAAWRESKTRKYAAQIAKDDRRRNFVGLMDGMRLEAERKIGEEYAKVFPSRLYDVRKEGAKIRHDLDNVTRTALDNAVTALCRLSDSNVSETAPDGNHPGRKKVTEAIDTVIRSLI